MSGTSTNRATDIITDKAKWLASVIRPSLKDSSDVTHSALFHTIREHYGMLVSELLLELLGADNPRGDNPCDETFIIVVDWKICGSAEQAQHIGPFPSEESATNWAKNNIGPTDGLPWSVEQLTTLEKAAEQFKDA